MALQEAAFERVVVVVPESGGGGVGGGGGGSSLSSSAAAAKSSQPLHNFSLPFLKWGNQTNKNKNHSNSNSRCRKLVESSSREFSPSRDHHRSSASEPDSAADDDDDEEEGAAAAHRHRRARSTANGNTNNGDGSSSGSKNRFSFANCAAAAAAAVAVEGSGSGNGNVGASRKGGGLEEGEEMVELVQKPWNLRPRRSACKNGGELGEKTENLPKSGRLRSLAEGHQIVESEKKKRRLVIALSRDEVDEDFFIMTGSKASRRPKKRAKNIQKLIDSGLPGLWLVGLTADSYTIPDVPAKK